MSLILHLHPLSSCCHKVLIAVAELGVPVEPRMLNLGDPAQAEAFRARWPLGKMPLLEDGAQVIPETSIQIEYLQQHPAAMGRCLIPTDTDAALQVRLWDRLCDLYVMTPMQACTADLLRAPAQRDPLMVAAAHATLSTAYALLEQQLTDRTWLTGEAFTLADCAAAPALFYARVYLPFAPTQTRLAAYFERLMARPSVQAVVNAARPWFRYFPAREQLESRWWTAQDG